jgi:hypothetical protein
MLQIGEATLRFGVGGKSVKLRDRIAFEIAALGMLRQLVEEGGQGTLRRIARRSRNFGVVVVQRTSLDVIFLPRTSILPK